MVQPPRGAPITLTSSTPLVVFGGLTPVTKVSAAQHCLGVMIAGDGRAGHGTVQGMGRAGWARGACLPAVSTHPTHRPFAAPLLPTLQYTVRAWGVIQNNKKRASANSLSFTTAADPTITLTKAEATSPTTGTATAVLGSGASFASVRAGSVCAMVSWWRRLWFPLLVPDTLVVPATLGSPVCMPMILARAPTALTSPSCSCLPTCPQYVFYAKSLACPACKPLAFPTKSLTAQLTKLAPGTTVRCCGGGVVAVG